VPQPILDLIRFPSPAAEPPWPKSPSSIPSPQTTACHIHTTACHIQLSPACRNTSPPPARSEPNAPHRSAAAGSAARKRDSSNARELTCLRRPHRRRPPPGRLRAHPGGLQGRKKAAAQPPKPAVDVVVLHAQPVPLTTELPGRTSPYRTAEVRPQVGGVLLKRLVTESDTVRAGQSSSRSTRTPTKPAWPAPAPGCSAPILRLKRELGSGQIKSAGADQIAGSLLLEDGTRYDQTGKLQFSEVTVDQGTGAITLRAIFPNPTGLLLPGMFVQEEVEEGIRQNGILAPQQGITHNPKGEATANEVKLKRPRRHRLDHAPGQPVEPPCRASSSIGRSSLSPRHRPHARRNRRHPAGKRREHCSTSHRAAAQRYRPPALLLLGQQQERQHHHHTQLRAGHQPRHRPSRARTSSPSSASSPTTATSTPSTSATSSPPRVQDRISRTPASATTSCSAPNTPCASGSTRPSSSTTPRPPATSVPSPGLSTSIRPRSIASWTDKALMPVFCSSQPHRPNRRR